MPFKITSETLAILNSPNLPELPSPRFALTVCCAKPDKESVPSPLIVEFSTEPVLVMSLVMSIILLEAILIFELPEAWLKVIELK